MTIAMPDSVNVNNLPVGYAAYLGYTDGAFATATALEAMFPDAELVLLTVTGTSGAHGTRVLPGTDVEPDDVTAAQAVAWARGQIPVLRDRPVLYASIEGQPGYGMADVLRALAAAGIDRMKVRLLSAHYGAGPHICGPDTCRLTSYKMDGTQWTDDWPGPNGAVIDMSLLVDSFFTGSTGSTQTGRIMQELETVQQGMSGRSVRTVQGLLAARGYHVAIDGQFGVQTANAVELLQTAAGITADGIAGPQTWPVLLGLA